MGTFAVDVQGATYEVDAPDEKTAWRWANATHAKQARRTADTPKFETEAKDIVSRGGANFGEWLAGTAPVRFAVGAAEPVLGAVQFAENVNPVSRALGTNEIVNNALATLKGMKQTGMRAQGSEGVDIAGIAGNALSPVGLGAAKAIAPAATAAGRIAQGTGFGAAFGLATPVTDEQKPFLEQKAGQAAMGAAAGGVISGGLEIAKAVLSLVNNVTGPMRQAWRDEAGRSWILDKIFGDDKAVRAKAEQAINTAMQSGKPMTAADAVALANLGKQDKFGGGIVAMEDRLTGMPVASDAAKSVEAAQEAGRMAELGTFAKTPADLKAAIDLRRGDAAVNYGAAAVDRVMPDAYLLSLMKRPAMKDAMRRAGDVVQNKFGRKLNVSNVGDLQIIKESMDDLIKNPETFGIGATEAKAIEAVQSPFVQWLSKNAPNWEKARATYAAQSRPINEMEIGQQLQSALQSGTGVERPGVFANAVRNAPQTIKKATGQTRFDDLAKALTPQQMASVDTVSKELMRDAERALLGKGVNANQVFGIAEEGKTAIRLPNLLSRPAMVTNWIMHIVGQGADEAIAKDMAALMVKNPLAFAQKYLHDVPKPLRQKVLSELVTRYRPVAIQGAVAVEQQ